MPRSRRNAYLLAQERLKQSRISDDDVLAVLRMWHFKENKTRTNVIPEGATSVHSDTLGVVRSRTGAVVATQLTMKYQSVFHVFCRWLREHCSERFQMSFPFTSISVNHGYAARKHRDGYNAGPSILKCFGQYTGGKLLYWPDDDGQCDVRELVEGRACCFDAKSEMLLFDGRRCHCVTPFEGERYSLVYFVTHEHNKVQVSSVSLLKSLGVAWPTEDNQRYFRSMIAPPRGNSKSIRQMFGYEDSPSAIQRSGTPLTKLNDALPVILSFVVTPMGMATICALAKRLRAVAWDAQSWSRSRIDTRNIRPDGFRAHIHWQLWSRAKYVINGSWALSNVGLLVCKKLVPWRWLQRCTRWGKVVSISQSKVPLHNVALLIEKSEGDIIVGLSNARYPEEIVASLMSASRKCVFYGVLLQPNDTTLFMQSD